MTDLIHNNLHLSLAAISLVSIFLASIAGRDSIHGYLIPKLAVLFFCTTWVISTLSFGIIVNDVYKFILLVIAGIAVAFYVGLKNKEEA